MIHQEQRIRERLPAALSLFLTTTGPSMGSVDDCAARTKIFGDEKLHLGVESCIITTILVNIPPNAFATIPLNTTAALPLSTTGTISCSTTDTLPRSTTGANPTCTVSRSCRTTAPPALGMI